MVSPVPDTPFDDIVTNNSTVPQTDALDSILGFNRFLIVFKCFSGVFRSMFPENIIEAGANLDIMGIIVFSSALGGVLVSMGESGKPLLAVFESLNEVRKS
jgi:Na+/H+-dicarboxylate symporter